MDISICSWLLLQYNTDTNEAYLAPVGSLRISTENYELTSRDLFLSLSYYSKN